MTRTRIEWTDHTICPGVYGCSHVSPACDHCYAERMARRLVAMGRYPPEILDENGKWSGQIAQDREVMYRAFDGLPKHKLARVFVGSMTDLWHEGVNDQHINTMFELMRNARNLTFQLLTKRPENAAKWWGRAEPFLGRWPPNVWMGVTVENQTTARQRVPHLLQIPAPVRFLSCEPLLGPIDLTEPAEKWENGSTGSEWKRELWACPRCGGTGYYQTDPYVVGCRGCDGNGAGIHWAIAGPETGPGARPMEETWLRSLRDQCVDRGVPFFLKKGTLDGKEWEQFPGGEPC